MARKAPRQWFERDDGFTPRQAAKAQRSERQGAVDGGPQGYPTRWRDDVNEYQPQWYAAAHNKNRLRVASKANARARELRANAVNAHAPLKHYSQRFVMA